MENQPDRVDVFGTKVSLTTTEDVVGSLLEVSNAPQMVAIANVHSVMSARRDRSLSRILNDADIVTPDGVPLVWALKASGFGSAVRVTGIDVMTTMMDQGRATDVGHFFYGSTDTVLDLMVGEAKRRYPGVIVSGCISPSFGEVSAEELESHLSQIRESGARVVWVGLGMPKQERWMAEVSDQLPGIALVGVGAAFDWFAGTTPMAPQWMRDRGLEWAYRLALNPGRMWKRYIYNNPAFLMLLIARWIRNLVPGLRRP